MENPVVQLLRRFLQRSELNRIEIVKALGYTNLTKGCRRLDDHLRGERRDMEFLLRLAQTLEIPIAQLKVALEATEVQERSTQLQSTFARRGPHLWVVLPPGYYPSLITVLGPEFFLLVPVPQEIVELADYEQFREVGAMARAHFKGENRRVRQVAGYRYWRSLAETYEFSTDGEFLGRRKEPPPVCKAVLKFRGNDRSFRRLLGIFSS